MSAKLTYFDLGAMGGAKGFAVRVCMRASGNSFEDNRIDFGAWGALKATGFGPLSQLPVLEIDGRQYCQSVPLSVYAAKQAGLYPTDPLEALKVDEVVAILDELWGKIASHPNEDAKREAYGYEVAPKYLNALTSRLESCGTPFFHGETPGLADLWVFSYAKFFTSGFFDNLPADFVAKASPALAALVERVKSSELYAKHGTPE